MLSNGLAGQLEQGAVLDPRGTHGLTSPAPEASIDMRAERVGAGVEPPFDDCPHEVQAPAWRIRLVA